jgi:FdhD protein
MKTLTTDHKRLPDGDAMCSRAATGELRSADGRLQPVTWQLPEEVAIALQINSEPYTVMMGTPANLREFAIGFMIAEGLISPTTTIQGILVMPVDGGMTVDVALAPEAINTKRLVRRSLEGRTGCGLCGVEDIADAVRPLKAVSAPLAPSTAAILKAAAALPNAQVMNRFNRTVHGAAWVSLGGDIVMVREDVGRHTALDKLIGALALANIDLATGFVMMTSRCSFELVQKCVTSGVRALVTVSAPTALAHELAQSSKLFLAALASGGVAVFNS